jgi:hypothetical protein
MPFRHSGGGAIMPGPNVAGRDSIAVFDRFIGPKT